MCDNGFTPNAIQNNGAEKVRIFQPLMLPPHTPIDCLMLYLSPIHEQTIQKNAEKYNKITQIPSKRGKKLQNYDTIEV